MLKDSVTLVKKFKLILQKAYMLNARMRHLEFKLINQNNEEVRQDLFNYLPGQFISILFTNNLWTRMF